MSALSDRAPVLNRETITKNIESVLRLEQEDERELSLAHRFSHRVGLFVGTIYFVLFQIFMTALWIVGIWQARKPSIRIRSRCSPLCLRSKPCASGEIRRPLRVRITGPSSEETKRPADRETGLADKR
jgi:hypothetical protein